MAPAPVLPEACYLINRYLGAKAERVLLASIAARELTVEPLGDSRTEILPWRRTNDVLPETGG